MADSLLITDDIKEHIGTHGPELLMLAYQSMDVWNDVTVLPGVKNETTLTSLKTNKMVKPYTGVFAATENAIEFVPNTIGVKVSQTDLLVEPEKYRPTYLAQFMGKGVDRTPEDLPFVAYIMEAIFAQLGEELNDETAWDGVFNAAGNAAKDVCDGYGTILKSYIQDGYVTPDAIGALTADDAVEQLKALYRRNVPAKYKKKKWQLRAYMGVHSYEAYIDNLEKKGYNTGRGDDMLNEQYLRGSQQLLELKPVSWMSSTDRVFITPYDNILLPADAVEQDLAKMNIIQDVWNFKMGIACALGFNFRYKGMIWCNEVD